MTSEELIEAFDLLENWEDRYRYIIELGGTLSPFPTDLKVDENLVKGCQSQVWLVIDVDSRTPPRLLFKAESDSQIVRGLIAIMMILFSDKTPEELLSIQVEDVFKRLGLEKNLSVSRRNGFYSMIKKIHIFAEATRQGKR